jgi:CheY-like chemotaxis protein
VNAQDAMPHGGTLTIAVSSVVLSETDSAMRPGTAPGPHAVLTVADTGLGMDPSTMEHIFEPFFTTKDKGKGTGLGLSTVFGIVRQHGGHLSARSEPGKGSTFTIHLPLTDASPMAQADAASPTPPPAGGCETILIVEDNAAVLRMAQEMLTALGYNVITAENGRRCLELLGTYGEPIDLLLTDVVMPGMDGRRLYERLSADLPGLRVVYMSGYTDDLIAHHGVLDEGIAFLQKPFTVDSLARKIRETLDR